MIGNSRRITIAIVGVAVCIAGALAIAKWREAKFFDRAMLLSRFPAEEATIFSADFSLLRRVGLLENTKIALEPEYKQFLEGTGFDYRSDLDQVIATFSKSGNFFIARGRFNWPKLREYVAKSGGSCYQDLCRMQGSAPERRISFLPLRENAIALAVSTDDLAANRLTNTGEPVRAQFPGAPVWMSIPGDAFRQPDALPPGLRIMLSALTNAERVVLTLDGTMQGAQLKPELHMEARCRTTDSARILESQLKTATGLLKEAGARGDEVAKDELAQALMAGTFALDKSTVNGKWPVKKGLLDSLTAGM